MYIAGATIEQLSFEFFMSEYSVREHAKMYGLPNRKCRREPPADLQAVLNERGVEGARAHFKTGWHTMKRWMHDLNIGKPDRKPIRHNAKPLIIPDDWEKVAPTKYKYELAQHYRVGARQINRMIEATGIRSRLTAHELAANRPPPEPKARKARRSTARRVFNMDRWRGSTALEMAASHLRRKYPNVHRCDIQLREFERTTWGDAHGVPNHGKGYYFVAGKGVMTEDELVALAEKTGFCLSFQ